MVLDAVVYILAVCGLAAVLTVGKFALGQLTFVDVLFWRKRGARKLESTVSVASTSTAAGNSGTREFTQGTSSRHHRSPTIFSGDSQSFKEWVFSVELAFRTGGVFDSISQADFASSFLDGNALLWYLSCLDSGRTFSDWESLKVGLGETFGPLDTEEESRLSLFALAQSGSLNDYIALVAAQARQAFYSDRGRKLFELNVGDQVMVHREFLVMPEARDCPCDKLRPRWYGPFRVTERITTNAYRLDLPHQLKCHPVFNVTALKKHCHSDFEGRYTPPPPPITDLDGFERYIVEKILSHRKNRRGTQYLVKWVGYTDATWEPAANLKNEIGEDLEPFIIKG